MIIINNKINDNDDNNHYVNHDEYHSALYSRSVDFHEFLFLVFLMTRDGSYADLVPSSAGHAQVDITPIYS